MRLTKRQSEVVDTIGSRVVTCRFGWGRQMPERWFVPDDPSLYLNPRTMVALWEKGLLASVDYVPASHQDFIIKEKKK